MGIIKKGILGGFSGAVGPIVGSSWKGISYMKSLPAKKLNTSSVAQIEQQLKFSLIIHFLQTFTALLELTFKSYANEMTAFNSVFSYNIKNAVTGISPDFVVDYPNALVSRGNLPNAIGPTATAGLGGTIVFAWADNSGTGNALPTDNAVLAIYCESMSNSIYTTGNTTRSELTETLDVAAFRGKVVQTWIAFISENGLEASNSFYTGQLTVS